MLLVDDERRCTDANPAACTLLGLPHAEIVSRRIDDFVPDEARPSFDALWRDFLNSGGQSGVSELVLDNGSRREVEVRAIANVVPGSHLSVLREINDRAASDESRGTRAQYDFLASVLGHLDEGLYVIDEHRCITFINLEGAKILQYLTPDELVGLPAHETIHYKRPDGSAFPAGECPHLEVLDTGHAIRGEDHFVRKDGSMVPVAFSTAPIPLSGGRGAVVGFRDVSERRKAEEELAHQALHDPLTGLANRQLLVDRLELGLARRSRRGGVTAVLFLDIDEFKAINDVYGHDVGDEVLIAVGQRLREALRGEDTIARALTTDTSPPARDTIGRLGGDEFVVVVEDLEDPADGASVAERILAALRAPLILGPHEISLDASVGITLVAAGKDRSPTEILRDGDTAMYAAKRAGKGRYELFEAEMRAEVIARTELLRGLRDAVEGGQLRLLYQPQVDLLSGRMTGVEALVRWEHPDRGLIAPGEFIPEAESTGMIVAIDDWVLREACTQLKAWDNAGLPPLHMAVNVSARRLVTGDLAGSVEAVLGETGVAAERLEIELTETVAVEHDAKAVEAITDVRALGVQAAIDDFGMGHSALSRLQSFPVDRLKIDRSFVASLSHGAERGSIADAMIAIGQSLGLQVVAEGVETQEHLRALRSLGCPSAQGYLFSKPVPAEEIEQLARAEVVLAPLDDSHSPAGSDLEPSSLERERLTRNLLAEIQRLTGLETTYLTRIDWDQALQQITHARNTGAMDIPEGLTVEWSDTLCRQALEQGVNYTDDVPTTFPGVQAAEELGLQTYLSVPLVNSTGDIEGTLCAASTRRVHLGPEAVQVMERCARILIQGIAAQPAGA